jgi:transposase
MSYAEIIFNKRYYKCDSCGCGFFETLGEFVSSRGVSIYLEFAILEAIKNLSFTYKMIASMYNVSDTFVCEVFDRHVLIPPLKLPYVLCIDEIYARRLTSTKYCCVLFDPIENKLIDILYSRRKDLLEPYFSRKSKDEKSVVKYFICDLNDTYRSIAYKYFRGITVVADSFHVIKNLSDAFRQIRIRIMKKHEEMRNETMEYWLLKKFHWMLEMSIDDVKKDYYEFRKWDMTLSKYQLLDYMMKVDETLTEAYYLKESYRDFNRYHKINSDNDRLEIQEKLSEFIKAFHTSSSPELRRFGNTLSNWQIEIINSFICIDGWRLSNAKIENINGQIKNLMSISYGFTNFERTRTRIIYTINEDYPFSITKRYKSKQRKK